MKVSRHAKIIELINQYDIETQEELAACLKEAGFDVTQATVSRDIRELKLSKISIGSGKQKYISFHHDETFLGDHRSGGEIVPGGDAVVRGQPRIFPRWRFFEQIHQPRRNADHDEPRQSGQGAWSGAADCRRLHL